MAQYFWQRSQWPNFRWDSEKLIKLLAQVRKVQGQLLAKADFWELKEEGEILTEEVMTTAAIEGEKLDRDSVRSSVARRLGLPAAGLPPEEMRSDGLVAMLIDATTKYHEGLSPDRLKGWQAALFPSGFSNLVKITVGDWRHSEDPMQVVSGPYGKEKVHYEAPPAEMVEKLMKPFLKWWSSESTDLDGLIRAAVAHLWFVTIHPFDDGNGRIARAITDMALAQDEQTTRRLYSMSAQILTERDQYYNVLEATQKGDGDATDWLIWFMTCLEKAFQRSKKEMQQGIKKAKFWQTLNAGSSPLNVRQRKVINRLFDAGPGGFEGGLTNRKYVSMTKTTRETAKRDITKLLHAGILVHRGGRGRNVSYELAVK